MKILVINGPNLNLLGTREPQIYGMLTLEKIEELVNDYAKSLDIIVEFYQSNIEGEIINKIQSSDCDGIVINPAGYSYTSVAIRDTLSAIKIPSVEVHISNIHAREEFRQNSIIAPVCMGQISGFGYHGYNLAIQALKTRLSA